MPEVNANGLTTAFNTSGSIFDADRDLTLDEESDNPSLVRSVSDTAAVPVIVPVELDGAAGVVEGLETWLHPAIKNDTANTAKITRNNKGHLFFISRLLKLLTLFYNLFLLCQQGKIGYIDGN